MDTPPKEPKRMYILVRESIPLGVAIVNVAHAGLACYVKFKDDPDMQDWFDHSFRKVVCIVPDKAFYSCIKKVPKNVVIAENNYHDEDVCAAFCPRDEWPRQFYYFRLYGGARDTDVAEATDEATDVAV